MINGIQNLISNSALYSATQSTATQVTIETCLKAVGRPGFILIDKDIDNRTKKFSATKEFLYQAICLGIYLAFIIPSLKKGVFSLAKKVYKNEPVFKAFKSADEFLDYHKLDATKRAQKLDEINQLVNPTDKFTPENVNADFAKGAIECGSILGTVAGLAILAPVISHPLIHPILKAVGLDKHSEHKTEQSTAK